MEHQKQRQNEENLKQKLPHQLNEQAHDSRLSNKNTKIIKKQKKTKKKQFGFVIQKLSKV